MQTMILNHYPPAVKRIKEIRQIARAEDEEFSKLNASINEVIGNMFVLTADETGVGRFEKLSGIRPKASQSLADRKACILSAINRRKMSLSELKAALSCYCENVELISDTANMEMTVEMDAGNVSVANDILEEILPLNISLRFVTKMRGREALKFCHVQKLGARLRVSALKQKGDAPDAVLKI